MAELLDQQTPGGSRCNLAEILPLKNPLGLTISAVSTCNLRCRFCHQAVAERKKKITEPILPLDIYAGFVRDLSVRKFKIKKISFAGVGEPLLHPYISDMVKLTISEKVADSVDIVTNGLSLDYQMSDRLIKAGLSMLRISINGLSTDDYKKNCQADVDFEKLYKQISYFYKRKKKTQLYIKIIDYMVETEERKRKFYELFSPICDLIAIECLTPADNKIDYSKIVLNAKNFEKTQNGNPVPNASICSWPFYSAMLNSNGDVHVCCRIPSPIIGNIKEICFTSLWNSYNFNEFRLKMIKGIKNCNICNQCNQYKYNINPEDFLDGKEEELNRKYEAELRL